jgi:wyosine [tRNA(Phe)-imidazoG37] synthetase (radical SAM superfamily)
VAEEKKYLYGPVPSRRLGRSLGIDIVPFKLCSLDCVYCQLGKTTEKTLHRGDFVPVEAVLAELKDKLAEGLEADFITIGGSGEPTLNSRLGELIEGIKKITDIPVAILTNGTLLYKQDVRADCAKADVVLPSLDAGDERIYQRINRPHSGLSIEKLISGLCAFRNEFPGRIWLEVFFIDGFNTDNEQIAKIKDAIDRIRPDKVQLNTAVRPTAEPGIKCLSAEKLQAIAEELGENCEVIADFSPSPLCFAKRSSGGGHIEGKADLSAVALAKAEDVLSMLKRRPCSLSDICSALGISRNEALKYITHFQKQGVLNSEKKDGVIFFSKRINL